MENKIKAINRWELDSGTCEMQIELTGEMSLSDVYEQWKGLMEAAGYTMEDFDGE